MKRRIIIGSLAVVICAALLLFFVFDIFNTGMDAGSPVVATTQAAQNEEAIIAENGGAPGAISDDEATPDEDNDASEDRDASGGADTVKYTVAFETNGGDIISSKSLPSGTILNSLPIASKGNSVFAGWYKDKDLTVPLSSTDVLRSNMTLYADYGEEEHTKKTPFAVSLDQAENFTITVKSSDTSMTASQVKEALQYKCLSSSDFAGITVTGADGTYTVASAQNGKFLPGSTNELTLLDDKLSFAGQDASTKTYSFTIYMPETMNLSLSSDMVYISASSVSAMTKNGESATSLSVPLATYDLGTDITQINRNSGTFTYTGGGINVGDTVCIYEGTIPSQRTLSGNYDNQDVAYVTITGISGTTYTYINADTENVVDMPEVLPVSANADTDGDPDNNSMTVPKTEMSYADPKYAEMGLNEDTVVEAGDFLAIYNSDTIENATSSVYEVILSVTESDGSYVIAYEPTNFEAIKTSMDIHHKNQVEVDETLTSDQISALEAQIEQQALASGFVDEAGRQVAEKMLESDAYTEAAETYGLLAAPALMETQGNRIDIENPNVDASISTDLDHFDRSGLSAKLTIGCTVVVHCGNKLDLKVPISLTFKQEEAFDASIDGGVEIGWKWIFPYPKDVSLCASIDMYNYTGLDINAKAGSFEAREISDQLAKNLGMSKEEIKKKLEIIDFAKELKAAVDGADNADLENTLQARYADMLQYETDWVTIGEQTLLKFQGFVDPLHIIAYGLEVKAVFKANLKASLGITYYNKSATRYCLRLKALACQASFDKTSIMPAESEFTFYAMGAAGLRAGLEVDVSLGLFDLDFSSITLATEAGGYIQINGYFYYQYKSVEGKGDTTHCLGSIYMEVGIYADVSLKAQLAIGSLSCNVPIYENTWPLWSTGNRRNILDFAYAPDKVPSKISMLDNFTTATLSSKLFTMDYFDMVTGETGEAELGADNFDVTFSNPAFSYDSASQTVKITPPEDSLEETGVLYLTYRKPKYSINSSPPTREIKVSWRLITGANLIVFSTGGGSSVEPIIAKKGASILTPSEPTRLGYNFGGWYTDPSCTVRYTFNGKMPDSMMLYAKWIPRTDIKYTVEHYLQSVDSRSKYDLTDTDNLTGSADAAVTPARNAYIGFTAPAASSITIAPDGSAVCRYYYERNTYTLKYASGYDANADTSLSVKYGSALYSPVFARNGYNFVGWSPAVAQFMPAADTLYTAQWESKAVEGMYTVKHYLQNADDDCYTLADTEYFKDDPNVTVTAEPNVYENYQLNTGAERAVPSGTVQTDNSLVLRLYYDRDVHTITYMADGKQYGEVQPCRYGAQVSLPKNPAKDMYTFDGWLLNGAEFDGVMPSRDITLNAKWAEGGEKSYTVRYYKENADYSDENDRWTLVTEDSVNKSATANTEVTEAPEKTYTHYTTPQSQAVTADADLDYVDFYYMLETYSLKFDANGGTGGFEQAYRYGQTITVPTVTREGCTFNGWSPSVVLSAMPASNVTYAAQWNAIYTVEHYLQNADNDGYTLLAGDTETHTVSADTTVSASALEDNATRYYDGTVAGTVDSGTVTDSSLVLKMYYNRQTYTLTFDANGGTGGTTGTYRCGQTVTPPEVTKDGYKFGTWAPVLKATMPAADTTYTAQWVELEEYMYTVEHYLQNANDNGYTKFDTEFFTADEDTTVTAVPKPDDATMIYNAAAAGSVVSGTVVDDSLVLKLYYDRKTYTLTFDANGGTGGTTGTYRYGQAVTAPAVSRSGYGFTGWSSAAASTMPAANTTYTAQWVQLFTYQVGHYLQNANDNNFVLISGTYGTHTVPQGTYVTVTPLPDDATKTYVPEADDSGTVNDGTLFFKLLYVRKTYTLTFDASGGTGGTAGTYRYGQTVSAPTVSRYGYAFAGWSPSVASTMPAANTTYTAQWTALQQFDYKVEHYLQDADDASGYTKFDTETFSVYEGTTVSATAKPDDAFMHYNSAVSGTVTSGTVVDGSLVLKLYYDRKTYTATFDPNSGTVSPATQVYRYGQTIYAPEAVKNGYSFVWSPAPGTMPAENTTFTAQWTAADKAYTVAHYLQNADGTYSATPYETDNCWGKTDQTVTATAKDYTGIGYNFRDDGEPARTATLTYGSNVVIKLYYDRVIYAVTFNPSGGTFTDTGLGALRTENYRWGAEINFPTVNKSGYIFIKWTPEATTTVPKENVTFTVEYIYGVPITTEQQLINLRTAVNNGEVAVFGKTYVLMNDITLTNGWTSIGENTNKFTGTFDGYGHTITYGSGFTASNEYYGGVFGAVSNGTIKNLTVAGTITTANSSTAYDLGGIVGDLRNSTIDNCTSRVTIANTGIGYTHIGGIAGYADYSTVKNCTNTGASVTGYGWIGGIVGNAAYTTITECSNDADVMAASSFYAGGMIGMMQVSSQISSCYNTGDIQGKAAGGIDGYAYGVNILNCYNAGKVTTIEDIGNKIIGGGIVANLRDSTIKNCYNIGDVIAKDASAYSTRAIGGVVGYTEKTFVTNTISNCVSLGNQITSDNNYTTGCGRVVGDSSNATLDILYAWAGMKMPTGYAVSPDPVGKDGQNLTCTSGALSAQFSNIFNITGDNPWTFTVNGLPILNCFPAEEQSASRPPYMGS